MIARARAAGYTAMFVTVDVPVVGNREGERISGMTQPWTMTPSRVFNMVSRPAWLHAVWRRKRIAAVHYRERDATVHIGVGDGVRRALMGASADAIQSAATQARYMQGDLNWDDLAWMRDQWPGPLYVKGVLDADDAAQAVDISVLTGSWFRTTAGGNSTARFHD